MATQHLRSGDLETGPRLNATVLVGTDAARDVQDLVEAGGTAETWDGLQGVLAPDPLGGWTSFAWEAAPDILVTVTGRDASTSDLRELATGLSLTD